MHRAPADTLRAHALALLEAAGLDRSFAEPMADVIVRTDLLGHRTHGLAMLPTYLERIASGVIARGGEITVEADTPTTLAWQAHRLPGAYVMYRALDTLYAKLESTPVVTATIANCSHIGSLQTYLYGPGERKLLALMMVTDPGVASVAPFGGADPVLTSNPIAAAIPTHGDPILVDQCTSLVSNAQIQATTGELPGDWILDGEGRPSRDPAVLKANPAGTLMPLGGADFGYKGFGFGLMVEAFALALSGHGRRMPQTRGAQGVFLQLIDPAAFAGRDAFLDETTELVRRCHAARPAAGGAGVRVPGQRAIAEMRRQERDGLEVGAAVWAQIENWTARLGVAGPVA